MILSTGIERLNREAADVRVEYDSRRASIKSFDLGRSERHHPDMASGKKPLRSDKSEQLAELLAAARRGAHQFELKAADLVPDTIGDGYAINEDVARRLGWDHLGWKIAGTTADVQAKLKIDHPIYGRTFRQFACTSPARFKHSELLDPLVECEFFVTVDKDLSARDTPWTMAELREAIASVHAGIEVAECRFPMRSLPALPAILADGSASGRYVFGTPIENWREGLADIEVTLSVDGVVKRRGQGADVMGDPIAPMLWLLEERRRRGDGFKAGETVSTGSMTGMLRIRPRQHVLARFGDGASVEINFED